MLFQGVLSEAAVEALDPGGRPIRLDRGLKFDIIFSAGD
jgi:hypothetical protein